jgi:hypothetical protein
MSVTEARAKLVYRLAADLTAAEEDYFMAALGVSLVHIGVSCMDGFSTQVLVDSGAGGNPHTPTH